MSDNPLDTTPKLRLAKVKREGEPNWIEFKRDLSAIINKHSLDVFHGSPDFMLADYTLKTIQLHREFLLERRRWFEGVSL